MAELPKYFYFRVTPVTNKGALTQVMLEDASNADVVEVVRCKDCKHYKEGKLLGPSKFCYYYHIGTGLNTADDDFCSHGERRVDNG